MKSRQTITQDDINAKLFEGFQKLVERMDKFDVRMNDRTDQFEANITAQMNCQLVIFTVIMVGVLAKLITA